MNYEEIWVATEPMTLRLERIAAALETIAAHLTKADAQDQASLRSEYEHLFDVEQRAASAFVSADNAMVRRNAWHQPSESDREWHRRTDEAALEAEAATQAFAAAHPEIADVVDAERRAARQAAREEGETEW